MGDRVISREEQEAHDFEALFALWQDYAEKLMGKCPCGRLPEWMTYPDMENITRVGHGGYMDGKYITKYHWWGKILEAPLKECNKYSKAEDFSIVK